MKRIILTIMLIAALGLMATSVVASKGGMKCGGDCSKHGAVADPVMTEIQTKYAADYAAIEKKVLAKREKMSAAWGKETTTVGEINVLRNEMLELKKEYLILNDKVQREYADAKGEVATARETTCPKGKGGCDKKGMQKQGCDKKDCGMKANKQNCQGQQCQGGTADCKGKADCKMQGKQGKANCGNCPKK